MLVSAWLVLAVALVVVAWHFPRVWRLLTIGAAYKARILATLVFGCGREVDPRTAPEVCADSYWMLRFFRADINRADRTVTASFVGLRPRTAIHRPGVGTTLLPNARMQGPPPSSSSVPLAAEDRPWSTAPTSRALDAVLDRAFAEPDPTRLRRTRAVVIIQDGRIVAERYATGFEAGSRFSGWSITKSVLSALVGILVGEGRLRLDATELWPLWRAPDPRAAITVEDLLRMRSGLQFSEAYSDLSSDVIEMLFNAPDAASYAATRALIAPPGTLWTYASGTTNILSGIVRRTVGEDAYPRWPSRVLFEPIGMTSAVMDVDAAGTFVCSSFMVATARDWARFGQLFLQDGVWEGRRILPEGWVRYCVTPTPQSPGGCYGAHWWLKLQPEIGGDSPAAARLPPDAYFAIGHEGQTLTIIPSRRLVIVRLGLSIYIDAWNHAQFIADASTASEMG